VTPTVAHAKQRAPVAFPGQMPGTTMHGRLVSVGGRSRRHDRAVIVLPSGRHVTRPLDQVHLIEEARP
jgi:hypothetical protein